MSKKQTIWIVIISIVIFLLYLTPNLLYYCKFHENGVSSSPEQWGQYGDFIGGSLNPVLAIANIIALIYLTFTVSKSDDKRILNQFKFDAYKDLKDKLQPFQENYNTEVLLMKEYEKTKQDLINFQQFSVFLFESDILKNKLSTLINKIEGSYKLLEKKNSIDSLKAENKFPHLPIIISGEEDFNNKALGIENMKLDLLSVMQKQILNK